MCVFSDSSSDEAELLRPGYKDIDGNKVVNGITISKTGVYLQCLKINQVVSKI
jgi:hypothetical protein